MPADRITDPEIFFNRRAFLRATAAMGLLGPAACTQEPPVADTPLIPPLERPDVFPAARAATPALPEGIHPTLTPRRVAASHNNYYEFLAGQGGLVAPLTGEFVVEPWAVEVSGECAKPRTFDLDDLFGFGHEERVYHFRCVERWAMNVPWSGFPLKTLLDAVEPNGHAKYVSFATALRKEQMPGLGKTPHYPWPYREGLRMDEAANELTMVVTGVYGAPLLKQHGAPVRIIVPWKYGYKSPKSIVKIELLRDEPKTFWQMAPHEYGFLSNVNPNIPHPRWSQSRSYWLDRRDDWFETPIYNGYGQYVANLYPDEPTTPQTPLKRGQVAR
jgi:sulfoxide reductase catalytic subunit YedY